MTVFMVFLSFFGGGGASDTKYTGVIAQLSLSQPSAASPSLPPPLK